LIEYKLGMDILVKANNTDIGDLEWPWTA